MDDLPLSSPLLVTPDDSALLIVDVQDKLIPAIHGAARLVWNIRRLIDAARIFQVRTAATEQYPKGLGGTVPELSARLGEIAIPDKVAFSATRCPGLLEGFSQSGVHKIILVGIEAHVCVLQTALDAICEGYQVYVVVDAVGSRSPLDAEVAIRRMESSGAYVTTTESTMFEWCGQAGTDQFRQLSQLVKERAPDA